MIITFGKILKSKDELDNENIMCPNVNYDRDKYWNLRLFIRVLAMIVPLYLLGQYLFYNSSSIKDIGYHLLRFLLVFIGSFIVLQIPDAIIHLLFIPNVFKDNNTQLKFFYRKRLVTFRSITPLNKFRYNMMILLPIIIFVLSPTIYMIKIGLNMDILAFVLAAIMLFSEEILNFFLQFQAKDRIILYEPKNEIQYTEKCNKITKWIYQHYTLNIK